MNAISPLLFIDGEPKELSAIPSTRSPDLISRDSGERSLTPHVFRQIP